VVPLNKRPLEEIEEKDLYELLENGVSESKTIDYKMILPGNSEPEKREFLRDVSSFANAAGGHLVYGIEEKEGLPIRICGLGEIDPDKEILRLENILRTGIDPRIPGVVMRAIPLKSSKAAIVIRIPKSWASPHMVARSSSRFFSRNSAGKYPLDVFEIRTAFLISEAITEKVRAFRANSLGDIVAGETQSPLNDAPKMIFQIVPFAAFEPGRRLDLSYLVHRYKEGKGTLPIPLTGIFSDWRYNFDGLLVRDSRGSYVQVFVNGIVEAIDSFVLGRSDAEHTEPCCDKVIASLRCEEVLLEALPKYTKIQEQMGVEPPFFIMLSILDVRGYCMYVDFAEFKGHKDLKIDRDALLVPEIFVESFKYESDQVLRPAFDAIWNAAGWERSMNYDGEGRWIGKTTKSTSQRDITFID